LENTASRQEATKVGTVCIVRRICRPVFGKAARSIFFYSKEQKYDLNRKIFLLSPKNLSGNADLLLSTFIFASL